MIILELSHPIVRLVRHVCSDKAEFSFCKRKPLFDALLNVYQTDVKTKNDPQFVISFADIDIAQCVVWILTHIHHKFVFLLCCKNVCSDVDYNEVWILNNVQEWKNPICGTFWFLWSNLSPESEMSFTETRSLSWKTNKNASS